ncbi:hypothetical protein F4781DRAFT_280218 [Annulohypoxylon bovei var. microspora]|nr:hypothetical protein F4781DRAFT_280218 [Annulohypoxylon bovei var. microspora]
MMEVGWLALRSFFFLLLFVLHGSCSTLYTYTYVRVTKGTGVHAREKLPRDSLASKMGGLFTSIWEDWLYYQMMN